MKRTPIIIFLCIIKICCLSFIANAQDTSEEKPGFNSGSENRLPQIHGTYFIAFKSGKNNSGNSFSTFAINRGFVAVTQNVNSFISSEVVFNSSLNADGEMNINLEYLFATFRLKDFGFISGPNIRFGILHPVWFDFEESINRYRMQGTMLMDRAGVFGGSDFGITMLGSFGGEVDEDFRKNVNGKYTGKYGGYHMGFYNGGGQHSREENTNKVFQGRLTLRPIPDSVPGFRLSLLGIFGKGNKENIMNESPDWNVKNILVTHESLYWTLSGQYFTGKGNRNGTWTDINHEAAETKGHSLLLELKSNWAKSKRMKNLRFIGRLDHFDPNTSGRDDEYDLFILGCGYDFGNGNVLFLDYENMKFKNSQLKDAKHLQLTMQINF